MFFKYLQQKSKLFYFSIGSLSIVNSIFYSGILLLINSSISHTQLPYIKNNAWIYFIGLVIGSFWSNYVFQSYMTRLTNNILLEFELSILDKLRFAPYQSFEKIGAQKIYSAIGDSRLLGQVPESMANVLNAVVVLVCGIAYMFYVSILGGIVILSMMVLLLVIYLVRNVSVEKDMNIIRDLQEKYHEHLRDLLLGFKDIKMSVKRNENIFWKYLNKNREDSKRLGIKTTLRYMRNELVGTHSWYIIIGIILFLMPVLVHLSYSETAAFVITILYLMGPVATLIINVPLYTRVKIALERVDKLNKEIDEFSGEKNGFGEVKDKLEPFLNIRFENVVFEYLDSNKLTSFKLGPINLEINKGEIIFVTGGNGSGKSTFINLFTGLYRPTEGQIYLNGSLITENRYSFYSNQISAIFTDYFLFKYNYNDFDCSNDNELLMEFIELMKMSNILTLDDQTGTFDINALSKGQQKRLALIYSFLEERPILVLDEWAAEQDPEFRLYFYKLILPFLKRMGKTILAVTHDDIYFDCSDRVIKFFIGNILEDSYKTITTSKTMVYEQY